MRIIESRSIDNQAGLLGSRLITGTNAIEGAFQSFIVAEDTVVTKVYNSIGIDVTSKLGLTSITLKAGAFISMPKGDYFSSIKLASGSVVAYFTSHGGQTITVDAYLNEFLARVGSSYLEASECVKAHLQQLINIGLLQKASLIMSPSMYEEDLVKSVVPQDGSGDLTFTRASDGTRVNSAGLVEVCPWNLLTYSEEFNNASWTKTNSSITANTTTAPNGTTTADKIIENSVNGVHFTFNVGATLLVAQTLSVYAKADTRTQLALQLGASSVIYNLSNGTIVSGSGGAIENAGNGWYRCSITTTPTNTNALIFTANGGTNSYAGDGTSGLFIWGAQLNTGTLKPYFPTTDRLNVPRLTYQNGGGGCPSLLLEKQSTNIVFPSEDFSTTWSAINTTVTTNQATAPDGNTTADRISITSNGGYIRRFNLTTANSSTYTASVYVKNDTISAGNTFNFYFNNNLLPPNSAEGFATININSGTVTSSSGGSGISNVSASIESLINGWYRVNLTFTLGSLAGGNNCEIGFTASTATRTFFAWGAQLEAGTYATSYIPTTSSSATRVADAVSDKATLLANKLNYSVFLDFYPRPLANFQYFFFQKNSSANAEIIWGGTSGGTDFAIYDYTAGSICNVAINDGNRHKIVLSEASGKIDVFVDGVKVVTQKSTSATGFYFFEIAGNPGVYKINELVVLPKITDADAIALTTL